MTSIKNLRFIVKPDAIGEVNGNQYHGMVIALADYDETMLEQKLDKIFTWDSCYSYRAWDYDNFLKQNHQIKEIAYCSTDDEFDAELGKKIALTKLKIRVGNMEGDILWKIRVKLEKLAGKVLIKYMESESFAGDNKEKLEKLTSDL